MVDDKTKEYQRLWRINNPEYQKNYHKSYVRKSLRKDTKEYDHKRYVENKDRRIELNNTWRLNNKERWSFNNRNRRHKRKALGKISFDTWNDICVKMGNRCQICLKDASEIRLTIDHIVPISKGGTNALDNLQPLCLSCNSSKSDKI